MRSVLFGSLRGYRPSWLGGDVVAGLTVWAVLVPEALAQDLRRDGVALVLARDVGQVRDVLRRAGADAPLVQVHRTIQDAIDAVLSPGS